LDFQETLRRASAFIGNPKSSLRVKQNDEYVQSVRDSQQCWRGKITAVRYTGLYNAAIVG
jgi:hypothetical protein